ncbi:30S ribosomal protein S4e [archaeon]|jgi:small subunit ribosomal protein S4e|nr:30S ribosomal protein S4e [archaeon]MBT4416751.1 30S ribosomal protein S4e [archaeon]
MVKNHLSRLNAPKSWPIRRKGIKFIAKPSPGPHSMRECIPLNLVVKELLKLGRTNKEVKNILNAKNVLINGIVRKDHKFPIGIMDNISVKELGKDYRVLYSTKGKFVVKELKKAQAEFKLSRIETKTIVGKSKVQLNMFDGTNILLDKNNYKTGDTLVIDLKAKKIKEAIKLEKGVKVYITSGAKVGRIGVVKEIKKLQGRRGYNVVVEEDGKDFETDKKYAFAIGKVNVKDE